MPSKLARLKLSPADKDRMQELMDVPIAYMPDDRFRRTTLMAPVMAKTVHVTTGVALTTEEEQTLFLQLNYARHRMGQIRRKLLRQSSWRKNIALQLLSWHTRQLEIRSQIVTANMGLVLAMAQRVEYPGVEFTDLISEGSMALLRATEKFDCARGIKFSTYACRAIFKGFSRVAKQSYRHRSRYPAQLDPMMEKDDYANTKREETRNDWIDEVKTIFHKNLADLTGMEISVVKLRFSLDDEERKPLTLKQVGEMLGLTKERIRQIQNKALDKLRAVAQERMAPA